MDRIQLIKEDIKKINERIEQLNTIYTKTELEPRHITNYPPTNITNFPPTNGWDAIVRTAYVLSFAGVIITELILHLAFWWIIPTAIIAFCVGAMVYDC